MDKFATQEGEYPQTFLNDYSRGHVLRIPILDTRSETGERCWADSAGKRLFDVVVATIALILVSPLLAITAIAVKLSSPGALLFRQIRMGKGGRMFVILKFRTMRETGDGPSVTKIGDNRLTPVGRMLRKLKLDELPQLINVLKGDMSLVGARPKLPHHQRSPLKYRPGITGAASLAFRNEEELLHGVPENALDAYQVHVMMPLKTELDNQYMKTATFFTDLGLLFKTAFGRGATVGENELLQFHESLFSLDRALTGINPGRKFEQRGSKEYAQNGRESICA